MPDSPEASVPETGVLSAMNLLPDRATGTLRTRPGYGRINPYILNDDEYSVRQVFYFETIFSQARHKYLIAIMSNDQEDAADNVKVFVNDLELGLWFQKASLQVPHPGHEHWGAAVDNKWYGGTGGIPMYQWDPETDVFNDDVSAPDVKTWVDDVNDNVTPATEFARDYAFKRNTKVAFDGKFYAAARDLRFDTWADDTHYKRGDRVSRWATWDSTSAYWKSFECIKSHDSSDTDTRPGTGADTALYWRRLKLGPIIDPDEESGDTGKDWYFMPVAPQSIIGTFWGDRLFLRDHDSDNWSRVRYSAPLKPEKHKDIADLTFDPTNWAPVDDLEGNGGGWFNVETHNGDAIRGFQPLGSGLIIFKRWSTHILMGTDDTTWVRRMIDPEVGTLGPRSFCIQDTLCYFLGPDGWLYVTDGTQVTPAPGAEKVAGYVKGRLDLLFDTEADDVNSSSTMNWLPCLEAYRDFVYITLPHPSDHDEHITLVYHPETQGFWFTDLPILDIAIGHVNTSEVMWFCSPFPRPGEGAGTEGTVFILDEDSVLDDDPTSATADITNPIEWSIDFAWMNFGIPRQDRRIRRVWAQVTTADGDDITITERTQNGATVTVTRNMDDETMGHVEGLKTPDAKAIRLSLNGETSTVEHHVYGVAVDTQPRFRGSRYHVNDPNA
jgi:hypothetical protein